MLLPIHNDSWNDGTPITEAAFIARMKLESACIFPDGTSELFYEDGDLFWGHMIVITLNQGGAFEDADIAG